MTDTGDPKLVLFEDVARVLKVRVPTVRAWVRRGVIPPHTYVKVGTLYRFDLDALLKALRAQTPTPATVPVDPSPVQLEFDFDHDE